MDHTDFHKELLASDEFGQYSLRATFFVRKLRGLRLWEAIDEVKALVGVGGGFTWNDRDLNPRVQTVYVVRSMTPEL